MGHNSSGEKNETVRVPEVQGLLQKLWTGLGDNGGKEGFYLHP